MTAVTRLVPDKGITPAKQGDTLVPGAGTIPTNRGLVTLLTTIGTTPTNRGVTLAPGIWTTPTNRGLPLSWV